MVDRRPNLRLGDLSELNWTDDDVMASLRALFKAADGKAQDAIDWYLRQKTPKARWSRALRFAAILSTAGGAMAPLVAGASATLGTQSPVLSGVPVSHLGYLLLALAAAMVGIDRFFGFSTAWMRYMMSAMRLQAAQTAFRCDWNILEAQLRGDRPAVDQTTAMLQKIRDFSAGIDAEIETETKEWIAEFRSTLTEIDKAARAQQEQLIPGGLDVTVSNASAIPGGVSTEVYLDGGRVGALSGGGWQMARVAPGIHRVGIAAKLGDRWVDAFALVDVQPGSIAKATIALPLAQQAHSGTLVG
jgi:hypothetical protein